MRHVLHQCDCCWTSAMVLTPLAQAQACTARAGHSCSHPISLFKLLWAASRFAVPGLGYVVSTMSSSLYTSFLHGNTSVFVKVNKMKTPTFKTFIKKAFRNTSKNLCVDSWYHDLVFCFKIYFSISVDEQYYISGVQHDD